MHNCFQSHCISAFSIYVYFREVSWQIVAVTAQFNGKLKLSVITYLQIAIDVGLR